MMNEITNITNASDLTMSSREIADLCEKRHDHVMRDTKKMLEELGEDLPKFGGVYSGGNGEQRPCFNLPKDLTLTLVSGYNITLRKRIIDKWIEWESSSRVAALPNFNDPIAAARAWADQAEARMIAERTKAEIGSRREATAMNKASQEAKRAKKLAETLDKSKQYACVKRMASHYGDREFAWRALKAQATAKNQPSIDVFDANYGTVKAYHADVWRDVYGLEIPDGVNVGEGAR